MHDVLVKANIEYIHETPFLVAILFLDGKQESNITIPYNEIQDVIIPLMDMAVTTAGKMSFELQTPDPNIYREASKEGYIYTKAISPASCSLTKALLETEEDILKDIYDIPEPEEVEPEEEVKEPPKWRVFCVKQLEKLLIKIKGDYTYNEFRT